MAEKGEGSCITCSKEIELFWIKNFNKCIICAENSVKEAHAKFIISLSPEQMTLWEEYNGAKELVKSMRVLDLG